MFRLWALLPADVLQLSDFLLPLLYQEFAAANLARLICLFLHACNMVINVFKCTLDVSSSGVKNDRDTVIEIGEYKWKE